MDPSLYTTAKWCSRKEESHFDGYGAIMCITDLSVSFWGNVIEIAAYILNRIPSKSIYCILYEIRKHNLKHFKILCCLAYVRNVFRYKLSAKSDKCRFVGYPKKTKRYYFYHPTKQKVIC